MCVIKSGRVMQNMEHTRHTRVTVEHYFETSLQKQEHRHQPVSWMLIKQTTVMSLMTHLYNTAIMIGLLPTVAMTKLSS